MFKKIITTTTLISAIAASSAFAGNESHSIRTSTGVSCSNSYDKGDMTYGVDIRKDVNNESKAYTPEAASNVNTQYPNHDISGGDLSISASVKWRKPLADEAASAPIDCTKLVALEQSKMSLEVEMQRLQVELMQLQVEQQKRALEEAKKALEAPAAGNAPLTDEEAANLFD